VQNFVALIDSRSSLLFTKISGDIVIMNKPNWYLFAKPSTYASTHGSPWSYDTNVPLAMYGPKWIKPGKYGDSEVVDLARTIAFILNVRPPNSCEGRVLSRRRQFCRASDSAMYHHRQLPNRVCHVAATRARA
jgi:hypothetical protein